ncbi:aminoglycoside phosphotransferase (APT) family kinase protein [Deinobacterium chartae]|uniref:Aminoglycoside phosphotransferase (APT) family kinase protein n=1 Tax=Deinobacterium chartae TaxID=521158 RepID=A0A841I2L9_9DEIO|nr:aminoglycoside phosphotransferase family protein [Deinobacterium chartae]MBB6100061.1 aminoglycoside phosphotransferase (APT) family kinase protein [Deinobacterium chartae]
MMKPVRHPDLTPLERRYGPLTRIGGGHHSEVYRADGAVLKVYRAPGLLDLEATHLRRAGLTDLLLAELREGELEVLVTRYFAGESVTAATLPAAFPALSRFLRGLHAEPTGQMVDVTALHRRLESFRYLEVHDLRPLFAAVEAALGHGLLETEARFCHLDLWSDNILTNAAGEVLVVDWVRAGPDDPMRDLALLKTGTLDLLPADTSLNLALELASGPHERARLRAYLALTCLHDLHWFTLHQPEAFQEQLLFKRERALHALERLEALALP